MTSTRYTFEREIGRGASGAVHLGRDTLLGRDVALKRVGYVPGGSSPEEVRAEREARIAASLSHPHLVGVFDMVHVGDSFWLVMEYVEGTSLSVLVKEEGALAPARARKLVGDLAAALAFVHSNQVVHRDVKPSNILVADPGGPSESAKLTDFGIARSDEDHALTQTGLVTGSPAYLSPEVVTGGRATQASDVWAVGATLFHLLAGRPPYDTSENVLSTMYRIVNEAPPRLETDPLLAEVLENTLVVDPEQRWTAAQVRDHLRGKPARRAPGAAATPTPASPAVPQQGRAVPSGRALERPLWQWVALAALVTVGTVIAFILGFSGGDDEEPGARAVLSNGSTSPSPSGDVRSESPEAPSASGSPEESPSPSETPSETLTPSAEPVMTDASMEVFARDYLATAPQNPDAGWTRLTPAFQQQAGGPGSYRGWWNSVASAEPLSVRGDAAAQQVRYQVRYTLTNGRVSTEWVTLRLVEENGRLLIAGES